MTIITPENIRTIAGINIVTPTQVAQEHGLCMGIYGPGGGGKTTVCGLSCLSEYSGKTLVVDAEGGSHVLSHLEPNIETAAVTKWSEIDKLRLYIKNRPEEFTEEYGGILWDNMSEMQDMNLDDITGGTKRPEIQHFGRSTADLLTLVRDMRKVSITHGLNVFFVLWDTKSVDEESNLNRQGVLLTNKLASKFPGIVNMVGLLRVKANPPGLRHLSFQPSEKTDAKFRVAPKDTLSSSIPLDIYYTMQQNPMADILATVRGGVPFPADKYSLKKTKDATNT